MTKNELINSLAAQTGLTKRKTEEFLTTFVDIVENHLVRGEKVQITGFGTFVLNSRAARHGVDPQTGADIQIPEMAMAHFRAGKRLTLKVRASSN